MKVRITKSRSPKYWYAGRIGSVFEVEPNILETAGVDGLLKWCRTSTSRDYLGWKIDVDDCEIVQESKPTHLEKAFWCVDEFPGVKIPTPEQARTEAIRLAKEHPGETHSVFKIDSSFTMGEKKVVYYE